MAFTEDDRRREARRLLDSPELRQKTESHRILRFLEEARQEDPSGRWSEKALVNGIHKTGNTVIKDGYVRANIRRARTFLEEHYRLQETAYGDLCLVLGRGRLKAKQGYYLDYEAYPGPYTGLPLGPVERFWKKFIMGRAIARYPDRDTPRIAIRIVFSDEIAPAGRSTSNKSDPLSWHGVWAGSGEVIGCYQLGQIFEKTHLEAEVVRSSSFGHGGSPHNTLIVYVGSSLAIRSLGEERERSSLKLKQRFSFRFGKDAGGRRRGEIVDSSPDSGDRTSYFCETLNDWMFFDYALISYFYDKRLNQSIVGAGGISTLGTEEAVKMITDPAKLTELLERVKLETGSDKQLPEFEVLLRVEVAHNSPLNSDIVAFSTPEKLSARLKASV